MKLRPPTNPAQRHAASHSAIYGFDRITLWLDRPELPIAAPRLKKHCRRIKVRTVQMPFNARWKLQVLLFQPTIPCLELLAQSVGRDIAVLVTYLEVACDLQAKDESQAIRWRDEVLASAQMRYQRQAVLHYETTWYYGRRNEGGQRRPNVLALYADKPSKLHNAPCLAKDARPCLHIEWRASGCETLESLGIVGLDDILKFDHRAFWDKYLRLYQLPRPTALGRHLAELCGADVNVSGTALRNRARRWKTQHSIDGKFVMHNALLDTPKLTQHLDVVSFSTWADRLTSR